MHNFAKENFLISCAGVYLDVEIARMGRCEEGRMEEGGNEATKLSMKGSCLLGEAIESKLIRHLIPGVDKINWLQRHLHAVLVEELQQRI